MITIISAPAKAGSARVSKIIVTGAGQINKSMFFVGVPPGRTFTVVVVKLIALIREETPARCRKKIISHTTDPVWAALLDRRG